MSMKVYNAYRLRPRVDLWAFIHAVRPVATLRAQQSIDQLYRNLAQAVKTESPEFQQKFEGYKNTHNAEERVRYLVASDTVRTAYRKQQADPVRNPFDLDVSLAFRQYQGRVYVRTHCDGMMRDVFSFFEKKPWSTRVLEEFHYQNQADPPAEISDRRWKARAKIYERLTERDLWDDMVELEIVCTNNFYLIEPAFNPLVKVPKLQLPLRRPSC